MHPAIIEWWRARQSSGDCASYASCGPGGGEGWGHRWRGHEERHAGGEGWGDGDGGSSFGVRRPLRFLAYKLELDDRQVTELAKVLDELKTDRAQAEVDRRRSLAAFADAVGAGSFDEARAGEAGKLRVDSAERLRNAVTTALQKIHALLDPEQREKLAYLIRTGTLTI
jgi:Spy/CpxP family protein refolding chaperone